MLHFLEALNYQLKEETVAFLRTLDQLVFARFNKFIHSVGWLK